MAGERRGASRPSRRHEADGGGACGVCCRVEDNEEWSFAFAVTEAGAFAVTQFFTVKAGANRTNEIATASCMYRPLLYVE